jgi:diguanylate cyclase (GGDEF)-like protein
MGTKVALVMVDIDNFKQINDGFGHKVGDEVIVTVARGLRSRLRPTDTVCRWGGDEMVLLITDLKDRASVAIICSKLTRGVKQETSKSSTSATVSLSMGSALFPDDSDDPTLLMQQADHALYSAKADGRDCWREFKGFPDGHDAKGKADLFIRLSKAVAENRISTFYQPIISTRTRKVEGAETLARWNDEKYGWVSPDVFIPLAEDKGLILQLGNLVIVQALDQLADWRQRGLDLTVSINLSKRQLLHAEFLPGLIGLMKERQLQPEWVILEITERQSVLGQAVGRQRLEELANAGFRISIDDFGSGYSSFDLVGEASFSELKIHLALIRLTNTQRGRRIVQAIVEMGRSLNLRVVAEGVEDQVTQAMLTALGVDKLQGYLFSKPLDPAAFLRYMERGQVSLRRAA